METKPWSEIIGRLESLSFAEEFDLVVGIAQEGIVPAYLLSSWLNLPLEFIRITFRDRSNRPKFPRPRLLRSLDFSPRGKKILLVDDRARSGATLQFAREKLRGAKLTKTFVINGQADYRLFDEGCFLTPWKIG